MNLFNSFRLFKKQEPSKPEHVHCWKPIAVKQGVTEGHAATNILQHCDCGEYKTFAAWSHWTLEQVSAGEMSKDVMELRKMAGL
jgi:hypothetical protein